jgi:hypothetical protein
MIEDVQGVEALNECSDDYEAELRSPIIRRGLRQYVLPLTP